ncbi:hypothetical protein KC644_02030, partial [Candidatus Berkelbacteria bacterium]|nr:hypothetical protein [Candidatus Berkelbacteria bacterium]
HVHSRFARACSKYLTLSNMEAWGRVKGIDLLGTADFTHPVWLAEIRKQLQEVLPGIYEVKDKYRADLPYAVKNPRPLRFILTHEIATIWSQEGKLRRMHTVLICPSMESAIKLTNELAPLGKLGSDGRPILGMSTRELAERAWGVDEKILVIPAHAWTPWFAVFGSKSGFDSLEECFGKDLVGRIPAIETGLSSDPYMNWQLSSLDNVALISTSDAHSPDNLGREATVFEVANEKDLSFDLISQMIWEAAPAKRQEKLEALNSKIETNSKSKELNPKTINYKLLTKNYLDYTIEFFAEEGKYHHDGHRTCGVCWKPEERKRHKNLCTSCGKEVTVGVLSRIDDLADRQFGFKPKGAPDFKQIVPIRDILSSMLQKGKKTKTVDQVYSSLVRGCGPEFELLMNASLEQIESSSSIEFATVVEAMRKGDIKMKPGYDGVYGVLELPNAVASQHSLFQTEAA